MREIVLVAAVLGLTACATAKQTYTADGKAGYTIDCSGSAQTWSACYQKAGELCGNKGYDTLTRSGDQGSTVTANQFGVYGGSVITRSMVISCKS